MADTDRLVSALEDVLLDEERGGLGAEPSRRRVAEVLAHEAGKHEAAEVARLKYELDRWRGAAPTSLAIDTVDDLITKTAEQANALASTTIHGFDDIGAGAGVGIRLKALHDAKAAIVSAGLRAHELRGASDEIQDGGKA